MRGEVGQVLRGVLVTLVLAFEQGGEAVSVKRCKDDLKFGKEQGVAHLALVACLVVVKPEPLEPLLPLGAHEVVAELVLHPYLGEELTPPACLAAAPTTESQKCVRAHHT